MGIPLVTIFTPVYNRAYIVEKLYHSLKCQTINDFEWIVVDDGSTDNTEEVLERIESDEHNFSYRHVRQENGGKHTAINRGVSLAKGDLFFIVDSDDVLTADAIEKIYKYSSTISEQDSFAGLAFLRASLDGLKIIGTTFEGMQRDFTSLERMKNGVYGDKAEIYYTKVLKEFPFPVYRGENFVTEALVWNRIAAQDLKMRWVNEAIYLCDYLEDGLTHHIDELLIRNFNGYTEYARELVYYPQTCLKEKLKTIGMYALRGRKKGLTYKNLSSKIGVSAFTLWIMGVLAKMLKR